MLEMSAVHHENSGRYCYAYNDNDVHIRLKTGKQNIERVTLFVGDPYVWTSDVTARDLCGWEGGEELDMTLEATTESNFNWFCSYFSEKKRVMYGFIIYLKDGRSYIYGESYYKEITDPEVRAFELKKAFNFYSLPYIAKVDVNRTPDWAREVTWYQILPDRFRCSNEQGDDLQPETWGTQNGQTYKAGGNLWGILDKLDYIQELGFNGLYLCPVFEGETWHKYDTIDYMKVDPAFGGNEALEKLVAEAHKRGMKVMLDAVFNHIGHRSPIWLDVIEKGEASEYKDWFYINKFPVEKDKNFDSETGILTYEAFADIVEMPKLNVDNPECRDYLLKVTKYWTEKLNLDAWRLDVSIEVSHQFWREFRQCVHGIKPDCFIVGENWHEGMNWLRGDQFDSFMNYPISQPMIDYFAYQETTNQEFMSRFTNASIMYPKQNQAVMLNLIDSHDTSRILTVCDGDLEKVKLMYVVLLTQPGSPSIYYGSELAMEGKMFTTARDVVNWDESSYQSDLRPLLKELLSLRKKHNYFIDQTIQWLVSGDSTLLAYRMGDLKVILNNTSEAVCEEVDGENVELAPFSYLLA
ncbi:glycoside hydrolase family 13 protein [Vibrio ishigakensis]|uniref:glycoside hydrolase family 13 protein n=1 Tax=Vibrio ishigakensis TaxID=1481914 RepID=UPI0021C3896A|nr:glycoside hydrolase family 13 protein [Vibrio ishigakensis]